ncbi:relaxase/mobilization nuclease domain-containing protein [Trichocoleus desertorum]|uniref:relaxase/mobilization nuclease domain-containing protein n=1 Tax=Trichocoleus desertorum TaxID=1481672 RepID=UPI003D64E536
MGCNTEGTTPQELAAEFQFSQQLNPRVNRVVYHASLSLTHSEHLENDIWHEIAKKYLQAMGFDMNQYAVVRHRDRDHAHIVRRVCECSFSDRLIKRPKILPPCCNCSTNCSREFVFE